MIEIEQCKKLMIEVVSNLYNQMSEENIASEVDEVLKSHGLLLTDLVIPWEVIDDSYVWAAQDEDGGIYIFNSEPKTFDNYWNNHDTWRLVSGCIKGVVKSNKPWKETLIRRPEVNPHALVIDWSLIDLDFIYCAKDRDGTILAYKNKPHPHKTFGKWTVATPHCVVTKFVCHGVEDVDNWHKTLTKRPEGV